MMAHFIAIRAEVVYWRVLGLWRWVEVQRISSMLQRPLNLLTKELAGVFMSAILTLVFWSPTFSTTLMAWNQARHTEYFGRRRRFLFINGGFCN